MRNVVSISLPDQILKKLDKATKDEGSSRSDVIKRSLFRYFFARDLSKAREKAMSELASKGMVLTDDDIFNAIS